MSTDISVQAVAVTSAGSDGVVQPKVAASGPPPPAEPAPAVSPVINPTLRLEPALGLVVIEFRNDSGTVTTSIPSQRQIEAYQRWETSQLGPAPPGQRGQPARASTNPVVPAEVPGNGQVDGKAAQLSAGQADGAATATLPDHAKHRA
jgi:hypothetical protein